MAKTVIKPPLSPPFAEGETLVLYPYDNCEFSQFVNVHGKARLAGNGYPLVKRRNTVRGR